MVRVTSRCPVTTDRARRRIRRPLTRRVRMTSRSARLPSPVAVLVAGLIAALVAVLVPLAGSVDVAHAYPPKICPTLSTSTTNPRPGERITVSGSHFQSDSRVTIALDSRSTVLGHATTNSRGSFSTTVTIPANRTGKHTIKAFGAQHVNVPSCSGQASQSLLIQSAGESSSASSGGGSGGGGSGGSGPGGTAFTGLDILALLLLAALLIA